MSASPTCMKTVRQSPGRTFLRFFWYRPFLWIILVFPHYADDKRKETTGTEEDEQRGGVNLRDRWRESSGRSLPQLSRKRNNSEKQCHSRHVNDQKEEGKECDPCFMNIWGIFWIPPIIVFNMILRVLLVKTILAWDINVLRLMETL